MSFFYPKFNRYFFLRLAIVIVVAWIIFGFILMPSFINGASMAPTYSSIGFNLCNKLKYKFSEPKVGDIVVIKYLNRKYFLKRIVALENDIVEFKNGILYVNHKPKNEPYLKNNQSDWNLPPRKVAKGYVYVVGDNRTMSISKHKFGEVSKSRIIGTPLW